MVEAIETSQSLPLPSGERGSRSNNFDCLRLLLAVGVIVSHAWPIVNSGRNSLPDSGEWVAILTGGQINLGGLCVNGFFVISGYLIAASWVRSRAWTGYATKRVLRIYPGLILAVAVSYGLAWATGAAVDLHVATVLKQIARVIVPDAVIVPGAVPHNPIPGLMNLPLWTIQYELGCYVLVMLLGGLILRRRFGVLAAAVVMLVVVSVLLKLQWVAVAGLRPRAAAVVHETPRLAAYFLAGTIFYLAKDRIPNHWAFAAASVAVLVVAVFVPMGIIILGVPAITYLMMWTAFNPRLRLHHFGKYGDFSYGTYLYAFPIQQLLVHYGLTPHVWQNILLAVPLSLVAGVLSWHVCEKHFVHYRRDGRRPA